MQRPLWLALSAAACLTACYPTGVGAGGQRPAENSSAGAAVQLPAENAAAQSPSGLTVTCEVFCSQTKLRTANARIRWMFQPGALAAGGMTTLANAKQTLEVSVFDQGFDKGLFATLPISISPGDRQGAPLPRPIAALAQGKPPTLRAYQIRLIEIERPTTRSDAAGEMTVVIEDLEPGMNYSWRIAIEAPNGRVMSVPVTCQAPTCPADMIRRRP